MKKPINRLGLADLGISMKSPVEVTNIVPFKLRERV